MQKKDHGAGLAAVDDDTTAVPTDAAPHAAPTHTPGPWAIEPHSDTDEVINVVSEYQQRPDGIKVANWIAELDAQIDFDSDVDAQLARVNANAHLIAAAPELYEALKYARSVIQGHAEDFCDGCKQTLSTLDAAIAKAEGRS